MATPRAFDHDLLKQLLRDNPQATNSELAAVLTEDNHRHGRGVVTSHLVAAAISRNKARWAAEGISRPDITRRGLIERLTANTGRTIPDRFQRETCLRRLRQVDRLQQGLPVRPEREIRYAQRFEEDLRSGCKVVDLDPEGRPFVRQAAPWELNADGQLVDLVAAYRPAT